MSVMGEGGNIPRPTHDWAIGLFLGDVHLSELERLNKACATARLERPTIRCSVKDPAQSAISSPFINRSCGVFCHFSYIGSYLIMIDLMCPIYSRTTSVLI